MNEMNIYTPQIFIDEKTGVWDFIYKEFEHPDLLNWVNEIMIDLEAVEWAKNH